MKPNRSAIDIQQAWQTAFLLRTCPDDAILRVATPDDNLQQHLASCSVCREKRAMTTEQVSAWQGLFDKFAPLVHQAVNTPQPGQIWVLKKSLSRWGDDGYYYSSPNVLLLKALDDKKHFHLAQLYSDERLMSEGDVWLGDRFGFAQSWNTYTIHQDALECWLGNATGEQMDEVVNAGVREHVPADDHSILSFFRKMEVAVGLNVAQQLESESVENAEKAIIDLIPGLKLAIGGAKEFVLDITMETLELLRGTFKPALVLRGGPAKPSAARLSDEHKKLIQDHCQVIPVELKITGETLIISTKWIHDKPLKAPVLDVLFNEVNIADAGFGREFADKIVIKHPLLSGVTASQISSLKLCYLESVLKLHITLA